MSYDRIKLRLCVCVCGGGGGGGGGYGSMIDQSSYLLSFVNKLMNEFQFCLVLFIIVNDNF